MAKMEMSNTPQMEAQTFLVPKLVSFLIRRT